MYLFKASLSLRISNKLRNKCLKNTSIKHYPKTHSGPAGIQTAHLLNITTRERLFKKEEHIWMVAASMPPSLQWTIAPPGSGPLGTHGVSALSKILPLPLTCSAQYVARTNTHTHPHERFLCFRCTHAYFKWTHTTVPAYLKGNDNPLLYCMCLS